MEPTAGVPAMEGADRLAGDTGNGAGVTGVVVVVGGAGWLGLDGAGEVMTTGTGVGAGWLVLERVVVVVCLAALCRTVFDTASFA